MRSCRHNRLSSERIWHRDKLLAKAERLLVRGAKMLVAQRAETDRRIRELREAQLATEQSLKAFIDSMRKSGNGQ